MKKLSLYAIVLCIALTGCGKKEEPAAEAAAAAPTMKSEKTVEKSMPTTKSADSLVASGTESVEKAVTDVKKAVAAEMPKVADIDFSKLSWDKVSEVPYADKLQLATWATGQADSWKGKLTEAAAGQGLNMLSKMGDTGWQGSLKKVMESVNAVRESNPETFDMARNAMVSAWGMFEKQASAFLAK